MLELLKSKWNDILNYIKQNYELSDISFDAWLVPLKPYAIEGDVIYIVAEEKQAANYINKRFYEKFKETIFEFFDEEYEIKFIGPEDIHQIVPTSNAPKHTVDKGMLLQRIEEANLNPKYTFDTFVVGDSNTFAHAYARTVAETPAYTQKTADQVKIFNPFFLYGGVGLGKTHLMHSIGNYILEHDPDAKVLYVTSETFTNELINIIRNNTQNAFNEFRSKYRNIDVLLIDDIQFISDKERCQEEFFHTFTTLFEAKKQIIISSDKPPKEMNGFEERLTSRFECGLTVDISSPEYETRMAILQKKMEIENCIVKDEILQYIATNFISNIRELEGALTRVIAYSKIFSGEMTLDVAKEVLKDSISSNSKPELTCDLIIQVVAEQYDVTVADIISKKKSQDIVVPRQICMYLCRALTEDSLKHIGELIGKRDHTTVIHGYDKIEAAMKTDDQLRATINTIKKKLLPD